MRLFLAVDLSPAAAEHLDEVLEPLRAAWPGVRWGAPSRWHLTLAFLGDVDDVRRQRLVARMDHAIGGSAVGGGAVGVGPTLSLAGAGTFPPPAASPQAPGATARGKPRVLWVGVAGERDSLSALAAAAATAARRSGITVERRTYRPHVTIGRTRAPLDLTDLVAALAPSAGPIWTVDAVHLFASRLGPSPRHERLASWPLPPPPDS